MKRKQFVISTIIALLLALFAGCKQSFSPALQKADQVLSTDTEKGSQMLDSICQAEPNMSTADKKYYQLLKLKASDKDYQPITNQKLLIDSLVSYFEHAGEDNLLAEAYFYAGRVYYEIGDKPEALKFYQKANEKVAKDNYALQGDIYCQMANVYSYTELKQEALEALKHAYRADSLSGNTRNMLYDLRDMGENYYVSKNYKRSEALFTKGLQIAERQKDTFMQGNFHHELANIFESKGQLEKAIFHINQYMSHLQDYPDKSGMLVTALEAFTSKGDKAAIEKCQQLMLKEGNIFSKQDAIENILRTSAYALKDSIFMSQFNLYIQYTDSVIKESHTDGIKKAEQSYYYKLKEEENKYLQTSNMTKSIGFIIAILSLIFCYIYFHLKIRNIKQNKKILELKLDKYKLLKEKNEYKPLDKLVKEEQNIKESHIYKRLMTAIEEQTFRLVEEDWKEIQNLINQSYENFDSNLRGFLDVTPQEYRICLLLKMGVSPTNIAHFVNLTKEAITASRRRMYTKAFSKKGKPADWDKIINSL